MAKIVSKSNINVGTELTIDEPGRTFTLNVAGNLVAKDGVTLQALYSKFSDLWATATYQDSPFPMNALDALSGSSISVSTLVETTMDGSRRTMPPATCCAMADGVSIQQPVR